MIANTDIVLWVVIGFAGTIILLNVIGTLRRARQRGKDYEEFIREHKRKY